MRETLIVGGLWFAVLRWGGVAYLLWRGFKAWLSPAWNFGPREGEHEPMKPEPLWMVGGMGFLLSLANPSTWLFLSSFFPQFLVGPHPRALIRPLAVTYFVISAVVDTGWALLAGSLQPLLSRHLWLLNRVTGSVLIAAGAGLALARGGR